MLERVTCHRVSLPGNWRGYGFKCAWDQTAAHITVRFIELDLRIVQAIARPLLSRLRQREQIGDRLVIIG